MKRPHMFLKPVRSFALTFTYVCKDMISASALVYPEFLSKDSAILLFRHLCKEMIELWNGFNSFKIIPNSEMLIG